MIQQKTPTASKTTPLIMNHGVMEHVHLSGTTGAKEDWRIQGDDHEPFADQLDKLQEDLNKVCTDREIAASSKESRDAARTERPHDIAEVFCKFDAKLREVHYAARPDEGNYTINEIARAFEHLDIALSAAGVDF